MSKLNLRSTDSHRHEEELSSFSLTEVKSLLQIRDVDLGEAWSGQRFAQDGCRAIAALQQKRAGKARILVQNYPE